MVLADMNDNVRDKDIQQFCKHTGLVEAITYLHGRTKVPMHQRGSKPIDWIFISRTLLEEAKGGFLDFGAVTVSDHRAVWLDINAVLVGMDHDQDIT